MRALGTTILLGLTLVVGVGRATADSECLRDAKAERGECRAECDEDFVIARDICRNIDPVCAAGCRVELEECRASIAAALESCVGGCRAQLNADKAACPKKGRGRDTCIDRAQVRAFLCRDDCREDLQVRASLNRCRQSFRGCMAGCAVPTEPPVPTPVTTEAPQPTEVPQPTVVPTQPPPAPSRTATPKPQPTLTPVVPR